ncbi:mitochondrial N-terminal Myb-like DNA-binding domain-containing protein [Andalucia godoyi]|uniref:Mitochondrial N-terminal Myb-like DNA-binding domain-containing protein n=1 Tax=Andalucia godoyi TaxID=505711 RepID=A0A8K0AGM1_ANDGO|nr:mitochondrial N-terminal Myb-like DNA-binding domain-containing protein [Andalucia godoyi]|eukprot:ANDGO_02975.mRNA.1 mitochondrial N-terminal Myb-like DNA-binding domain-containing protein
MQAGTGVHGAHGGRSQLRARTRSRSVRWSKEEDHRLLSAVRIYGDSNWTAIARYVSQGPDTTSPPHCEESVARVDGRSVETNENHHRSRHSLPSQYALRPANACSQRYRRVLDPRLTRDRKWTVSESIALASLIRGQLLHSGLVPPSHLCTANVSTSQKYLHMPPLPAQLSNPFHPFRPYASTLPPPPSSSSSSSASTSSSSSSSSSPNLYFRSPASPLGSGSKVDQSHPSTLLRSDSLAPSSAFTHLSGSGGRYSVPNTVLGIGPEFPRVQHDSLLPNSSSAPGPTSAASTAIPAASSSLPFVVPPPRHSNSLPNMPLPSLPSYGHRYGSAVQYAVPRAASVPSVLPSNSYCGPSASSSLVSNALAGRGSVYDPVPDLAGGIIANRSGGKTTQAVNATSAVGWHIQWSSIARYLHGRHDTAIRFRWLTIVKRSEAFTERFLGSSFMLYPSNIIRRHEEEGPDGYVWSINPIVIPIIQSVLGVIPELTSVERCASSSELSDAECVVLVVYSCGVLDTVPFGSQFSIISESYLSQPPPPSNRLLADLSDGDEDHTTPSNSNSNANINIKSNSSSSNNNSNNGEDQPMCLDDDDDVDDCDGDIVEDDNGRLRTRGRPPISMTDSLACGVSASDDDIMSSEMARISSMLASRTASADRMALSRLLN